MKPMFCWLMLLVATLAFAQQPPGQPQPGQPPQSTPPTFPEGEQSPRQMPPDQPAPAPEAQSSEKVQQQITQQFSAEPTLANTNVRAEVDEASVVVSGTVGTANQHDLALHIAKSYAGDRNVVDKIKVKQQV
jgi:hypothetical protein